MTKSLLDLPVLVVDCQATGGSPRTGHLLDLGWCVTRAADPPPPAAEVRHHLARLPRGATVPRPVTRLTGITTAETRAGRSRRTLWRDLGGDAAALRNGEGAFCVAHYARFEEGFLRALYAECAPADPFPLRFLCTHEICRRLFPDLPRRGLRAVAGLFGYAAPELKRAGDHVAATAGVWAGLVHRLRDEHGVETLEDLRRLLAEPPRPRSGRWEYPLPRETRLRLPDLPGVYRFLGGDGGVLYVGKARSLRARVNSYYRQRRAPDKVLELLSQARDVDVSVTATALEASLLEAAEIQRLAPRYNQALRVDDPRVWFFSTGFESARARPDRTHRRGPVPDRRPFAVLRALAALLTGERSPAEGGRALSRALDLPGPRREAAITAGAQLLAERHGLQASESHVSGLLALGRRLARERAVARAAERERSRDLAEPSGGVSGENDPPADADDALAIPGGLFGGGDRLAIASGLHGDDKTAGRRGATAESVADWLEGTLVYAARLTSRARWFAFLADSTLCWRPAAPSGEPAGRHPPRRAVVVRGGSISMSCNLLPGETPPLPAGAPRRDFDRAGYDRLRVLTTEIRRLLAEGREVELHLPPRSSGGADPGRGGPPRRLGTRVLRRILERF